MLAIFKHLRMDRRLSLIIEGESLLNDGTAAALFQILLAGIIVGHLGVAKGVGQFFLAVLGGGVLGSLLGYAASRLTRTIDDPEVQITLTAVVAYGSYLLAYQLYLSGIIATASAGLVVGNLGTRDCSKQTKTALESFWAYIAFLMNSLVFLLIGLEVHVDALLRSGRTVLLCVAAVLVGRALSVYMLVPVSNTLAEKIPLRWQHLIVWGGLRGSLALALALSLDSRFPDRDRVLDLTFGVVVFSILVQGLTIKPLLRILGLSNGAHSTDFIAKAAKTAPNDLRRQDLQPPFRSKQEVIVNAPLEEVWSYTMDLTKIPEFHPRVVKVDLLSGKTLREPGVSYRCHLSGGNTPAPRRTSKSSRCRRSSLCCPRTHSVSARFSRITKWKRRSKRSASG